MEIMMAIAVALMGGLNVFCGINGGMWHSWMAAGFCFGVAFTIGLRAALN